MGNRFAFPKAERLKSRKQIDVLFAKGKHLPSFPVRLIYQLSDAGESGVQAGFTASKKNFKKAVDRNRIKRLLREAYRLQKADLAAEANAAHKKVDIFLVYTGKALVDFETIKTATGKCLQKLATIIQSEIPS
jgi:ribonuclease P protein component